MPNPNTIPFTRYQDIQIPDVPLRQQFQRHFEAGQYYEASTLLLNNADQLNGKVFNANTINILINGILILENYYNDGVTLFLSNLTNEYQIMINNFIRRGTWLDSIQYTPYNFVVYNNNIYMCIQEPPIGTLPTNTTYWLFLGLNGEQGAPGVDVNMRYGWIATETYAVNDLVVYNDNIYVAIRENTGLNPANNPDDWLLFIQFERGQIYVGTTDPTSPINDVVWFQTDTDPSQATDTTPILGQFKRYLGEYATWDDMYPNTLFNWVNGYSDYNVESYNSQHNVQVSDWTNNTTKIEYYIAPLAEQTIVDVMPDGELTTEQQNLYNSLSLSLEGFSTPTDGITLTLTSNIIPTVNLPIQVQIIP